MKKVTLMVEPSGYAVYEVVGEMAGGLPVERVMSRALLMLSVELAVGILRKKQKRPKRRGKAPRSKKSLDKGDVPY